MVADMLKVMATGRKRGHDSYSVTLIGIHYFTTWFLISIDN
jgi:hypothetical protein